MSEYPVSPEHDKYRALLPAYLERVQDQEDMFSKAGLPADGMTKFITGWFEAWNTRDNLESLRACMTPDCSYVDASSFDEPRFGREVTLAMIRQSHQSVPDMAWYPQSAGPEALPYWDFLDGQVRASVPWRMIGRVSRPLDIPDLPYIPATGRCLNLVGVDRYILTSDWKIARIDDNYDLLKAFMQTLGIPQPVPGNGTYKVLGALGRAAGPGLRLLSRMQR